MRAKVQMVIGLITSIVSIAGVLVLFTRCLIYHLTQRPPCAPYIIFPLGSILPVIYGIFLIRGKIKWVHLIFWVWLISWIIALVLMFLGDVVYYRWLQRSSPDLLDMISLFLEVIVGFPTFAFLEPIVDISSVYLFGWRAVSGTIVMVLLWIGMKGLEQTSQIENATISGGTNQK